MPTDNGAHWALCDFSGSTPTPACTGTNPVTNNLAPGSDQAYEVTSHSAGGPGGSFLDTSAACDTAFDGTGDCTAAAQESEAETIHMQGPTASTDASTSFTTTVVWTAVP